jgi:hypothetical protein
MPGLTAETSAALRFKALRVILSGTGRYDFLKNRGKAVLDDFDLTRI